ncbi:MAG: NAD-dependent epimerase/dehydratase family protein [Reyranellaceae bacterium]
MRCLVTGTAGFVGFHLARRLLEQGHEVFGIDGMTPYYDPELKQARHAELGRFGAFQPHICLLEEADRLGAIYAQAAAEVVFHLAAQAGVRYSLENPRAYIESNIDGSFNLLELCRRSRPRHLLIASTSSVYGNSTEFPLAETGPSDHPITLYAASKKAVEAIAHSYAHLWDIPTTLFRFFTVYGPWGRPDMAYFKFAERILAGRAIDIYNHGRMERDFTYVDDLVEAIIRLCNIPPTRGSARTVATDSSSADAPYRIVNIGGRQPVKLLDFIEEIERAVGKKAIRNYMELQPGDVLRTEASTDFIEALIGYRPSTPLSVGIGEFVRWYRDYYKV